jgi:NAD(P)-dependent dehydrogenase (short-subunit alcohol dehydrogenase family)
MDRYGINYQLIKADVSCPTAIKGLYRQALDKFGHTDIVVAEAINKSGVKRVVYLSSIGEDMSKVAGLIVVHYHAENTLNKLPSE